VVSQSSLAPLVNALASDHEAPRPTAPDREPSLLLFVLSGRLWQASGDARLCCNR
jgi:hypothetical protein